MTSEERKLLRFYKMVTRKLIYGHFKLHRRLNISEYIINYPDPKNKYASYKNNGVAQNLSYRFESIKGFSREIEGTDVYWINKNTTLTWSDRNPFLDKLRTGFITFLFSVGAAILLYYILPPRPSPDNSQQNQHLIRLSDSLKILDTNIKALEDTLSKYKATKPLHVDTAK